MFVDPKILIMKCEKTHCVCQIGVWCEKGLCVDDDVLLPPPPQPPTHPSTSTRLRSVNVTVTSLDNQVSMDLIESSVMERGRGGAREKKTVLVLLPWGGKARRVLGWWGRGCWWWWAGGRGLWLLSSPLTFQSCNLISWVGQRSGGLRGYRWCHGGERKEDVWDETMQHSGKAHQ